MKLLIISAVFFILLDLVTGQSAWATWTGQGQRDRQYWMDSATQCSLNNVFDVGTSTSTIYGKAAVQVNPGALTECYITLKTGIPREKRRFSVEIVLGNVNEPGVQFTMYDGSDTGSNRLFTISLGQRADRTKKYVTSGGFVTFYLKKDSPGDADISIQMIARVIPGDITSKDESKTGNEYGCSVYGYTTPIDKETIIGIIGVAMDSVVNCGRTVHIYDRVYTIKARADITTTNPDYRCILVIDSGYSDSYQIQITQQMVAIEDCGVKLNIYEGSSAEGTTVKTLGCTTKSTGILYSKYGTITFEFITPKEVYNQRNDFSIKVKAFRDPNVEGGSRLPAGAIVGIIVGLVVLIAFTIILLCFYLARKLPGMSI